MDDDEDLVITNDRGFKNEKCPYTLVPVSVVVMADCTGVQSAAWVVLQRLLPWVVLQRVVPAVAGCHSVALLLGACAANRPIENCISNQQPGQPGNICHMGQSPSQPHCTHMYLACRVPAAGGGAAEPSGGSDGFHI